jgi:alpha-tubulin suppressor-like RCC1 family protein
MAKLVDAWDLKSLGRKAVQVRILLLAFSLLPALGACSLDTEELVPVVTPFALSSLASGNHVCGLSAGGGVWCWGNGGDGQLGDNVVVFTRRTPVRVSSTDVFTSASAGLRHTCAVNTDGLIRCWGLERIRPVG